jgi:hypothetical protein
MPAETVEEEALMDKSKFVLHSFGIAVTDSILNFTFGGRVDASGGGGGVGLISIPIYRGFVGTRSATS